MADALRPRAVNYYSFVYTAPLPPAPARALAVGPAAPQVREEKEEVEEEEGLRDAFGGGVTVTIAAAAPPLPTLLATVDGSRPSATQFAYRLTPAADATTATLTIAPADPAFVTHCTQVRRQCKSLPPVCVIPI